MLLLLPLTLALLASSARGARRVPVSSVVELRTALSSAQPDDTIELAAPGEYVVDSPLVLDTARVEVRSVAGGARAVLRAASGAEVLLDVRASDVALRDLVIGHAASGDAVRRVDVLVDAGTYTDNNSDGYAGNGGGAPRKRSVGSLVSLARSSAPVRTAQAAAGAANRALRNFVLQNVDFSASRAAVNLAFARGAYIAARVESCVFGAHAASAAIVAAPEARFADWVAVRRNVFDAAPLRAPQLTDDGAPLLARNFWTPAAPRRWTPTYCADRSCALLGPVADGARPAERAYATVAAALGANVGHVLVTAAEAPLGGSVNVTRVGTLLEGRASGCTRATVLVGANETIASEGGALAAVRDLRFRLHSGAATALSYGAGGSEADVELERVAFVGDGAADAHCALNLSASHVRLAVRNSLFAALARGIVLGAGALTIADSTFVGHSAAAIAVRGSGAATGLSVAGTLFVGAPHGALVYDASVHATRLAELYVGCSRFVDAPLRAPADCSGSCAGALAHNTLIERIEHERALPDGRALARGANHVERVSGSRGVDTYVKVALGARGGAHWFSLADHQGRLEAVRAAVTGLDDGAFMLASYVPMRSECFAGSLPADVGAAPRVVSNVWELASDAPDSCVAVELQFAVADVNATAHDAGDLSVRSPTHIDAASATQWGEQVVETRATLGRNGAVVRASAARGVLRRAAVLAAHANEHERAAAIETGSLDGVLAVPRAERQLCVACGTATLPAHALDERCGGDSDAVFGDFDAALAAASAAREQGESVSLLVYGDACATAQCTLALNGAGAGALTLEGLSATERGGVHRPAACAAEHPAALVGAGVTLRYLTLAPEKVDAASAVPRCALAVSGEARVAFSALAGGVCVAGDVAGQLALFGNEIEPARNEPALYVAANSRVLGEGNTLGGGGAVVRGTARLDSNSIRGALRAVGADAELTASANRFDARAADASDATCVAVRDGARLTATDNVFGAHCELELHAAGRVRISGGAARTWRDVRLSVAGAARDVRISQVTLLGRNAAIGVLDGAKSSIVLHDVALDLAHTTLADALVGGASARSACAAAHEAALGGFALGESVLVHASTAARLLARTPQAVGLFVDPVDGALRRCADVPSAAYCQCVTPPPLAAKPRAAAAKPRAAAAKPRAAAAKPRVVTASVDDDDDDGSGSSTALRLIPLWIALGILLLCAVGACILYASSRRGGAAATAMAGSSAATAIADHLGYSLAVDMSSEPDEPVPIATAAVNLRHRASHRRRGQ